jgi:hypothetical protein
MGTIYYLLVALQSQLHWHHQYDSLNENILHFVFDGYHGHHPFWFDSNSVRSCPSLPGLIQQPLIMIISA